MGDITQRTSEDVRALMEKILSERLTDVFLVHVSQPGNLDWLASMINTAFDRVERKQPQSSSVSGW